MHVEGFTDNQPISTAAYPSNWELSAPCIRIVRMLSMDGVNPARLAAVGYGEFQRWRTTRRLKGAHATAVWYWWFREPRCTASCEWGRGGQSPAGRRIAACWHANCTSACTGAPPQRGPSIPRRPRQRVTMILGKAVVSREDEEHESLAVANRRVVSARPPPPSHWQACWPTPASASVVVDLDPPRFP